jgi:hypothetical protein
MGINERYQRKLAERAQLVLGDQVKVRDAAATFAGPHPLYVAGGLLALAVLVFVLTHTVIGWLVIFAVRNGVGKPRTLAVTDRGLAVLRNTFFMLKPKELLATAPTDRLVSGAGPAQANYVPVQLDPERLWVPRKALQRLVATTGAPSA